MASTFSINYYCDGVTARVSPQHQHLILEVVDRGGVRFNLCLHGLPEDRARAIADAINGKGDACAECAVSEMRNTELRAENRLLREMVDTVKRALTSWERWT